MTARRTNPALRATRRWTAGALLTATMAVGGLGLHLADSYAASSTVVASTTATPSPTVTTSTPSASASTSTPSTSTTTATPGPTTSTGTGFTAPSPVASSTSGTASTTTKAS